MQPRTFLPGLTPLLPLLAALALFASACSSDGPSLIAGDDTAAADAPFAEDAQLESPDPDLIGLTPMSNFLIEGTLWSEAELASLRGTAWVLFQFNDEFYEDASLSFAWVEGEGLRITYRDPCAMGSALITGEKERGEWLISNENPHDALCPDSPAGLFADDSALRSIHFRSGELTVEAQNGYLRAHHWQSTSVHDEPIEVDMSTTPQTAIPNIPLPDLEEPTYESLAEVNTASEIPFPACASSGRAGIEPNPRLREILGWGEALQEPLRELPFVVGYGRGGGSLYNHEVNITLSARYQPTIDWLTANVTADVICLEYPPLGYYAGSIPDRRWSLADEVPLDPTATSVAIRSTDCGVHEAAEHEVTYGADEIEIRFPGYQLPFGVGVAEPACASTWDVPLDEPIGNRTIVPRFTE